MNKQELAESMAEFLGEKATAFLRQRDGYVVDLSTALFSPDGFFAVWDKVEKTKHFVGMEMYIPPDEDLQGGAYSCTIAKVTQEQIIECGIDKYTAFYSAVHEIKTQKEKALNDQERIR